MTIRISAGVTHWHTIFVILFFFCFYVTIDSQSQKSILCTSTDICHFIKFIDRRELLLSTQLICCPIQFSFVVKTKFLYRFKSDLTKRKKQTKSLKKKQINTHKNRSWTWKRKIGSRANVEFQSKMKEKKINLFSFVNEVKQLNTHTYRKYKITTVAIEKTTTALTTREN